MHDLADQRMTSQLSLRDHGAAGSEPDKCLILIFEQNSYERINSPVFPDRFRLYPTDE